MMKTKNGIIYLILLITAVPLLLPACRQWDNFTTYFNTYYNTERLRKVVEDEFEFQEEKKRVMPRVFVPEPKFNFPDPPKGRMPQFLASFVITKQKRQPVKRKLDSIIIKGSKILANHPKSDYIEGTLYLMALSYFYQNIWLNSQIKCSELIDRYPAGEKSPDAHLLMSLNLLIQRKYESGKIMLSRTVDIAWQLERYDILSEAFRIEAELALYEGDEAGASRPYKQAIAQSDDDALKAMWQVDLAALHYRLCNFKKAEKLFAKARNYSPDYVQDFESQLYQGACLAKLGRFDEAEAMFESLANDNNNEEWLSYVYAERMTMMNLQKEEDKYKAAEAHADTAFVGSKAVVGSYYQRATTFFFDDKYSQARKYFSRSRVQRTPIKKQAEKLYRLLNTWEKKRSKALRPLQDYFDEKEQSDSLRGFLALNLFELGRVHEQLGNRDSSNFYYSTSIDVAPALDSNSARYLYVYSRFLEQDEPYMADSLMDLVVHRFPLTEYGQDAIVRLGYTDAFIIDTVAELYQSGAKLRNSGDYQFAINQFMKIYTGYPKSFLAPKALYSVGWTYERNIQNYDSAYHYYSLLIHDYPKTEYAKDLMLSLAYLYAVNSGGPIPDSLKRVKHKKRLKLHKPKPIRAFSEPKTSTDSEDSGFNPMDMFKKAGDMLKNVKDAVLSPGETLDKGMNQLKTMVNVDSLKSQLTPS
ncbi:MAG: hypothetical protein PF588_02220, partial [Candidatus Kapabacteria bacterium]|nr:hypothetical protein [Candidatus Kapabacteria bacterium]